MSAVDIHYVFSYDGDEMMLVEYLSDFHNSLSVFLNMGRFSLSKVTKDYSWISWYSCVFITFINVNELLKEK